MSLACGAGLERAELAIRAAVLELGRAVLEPLLAADAGYRGPRAGCGAGHQAEFVSYRDKTIDTVLGPVTLRRAWYHCAACGHGFAPRDRRAGRGRGHHVAGTGQDDRPGCRRAPVRPPPRGWWASWPGSRLTSERARRRAEADGQAAALAIEAEAAAIAARQVVSLPPAGPPRTCCTSASTAPACRSSPPRPKAGTARARTAQPGTREVKLCCVFTQTAADEKGRPVRDPRSSSYLITFEPAAQLRRADGRRGPPPRRRSASASWCSSVTAPPGSGTSPRGTSPQATQIVDLYHAREHLHDLARLLEFMLGDHKQAWLEERLADLDDGDIPAICAAARAFPLAGKKAADLGHRAGLLRAQRPPHALRPLQEAGHVRRLRAQSRQGANRSSRSAASCPG